MFTSSSLCCKDHFCLFVFSQSYCNDVLYWSRSTIGRSGTTQQFVPVQIADILYYDWTGCQRLIWYKPVPENRTVAVIGSNQERNVVQMRAAICWWGMLGDENRLQGRLDLYEDRLTKKIRNCLCALDTLSWNTQQRQIYRDYFCQISQMKSTICILVMITWSHAQKVWVNIQVDASTIWICWFRMLSVVDAVFKKLIFFFAGLIWARYSLVIIPKNWLLFSVNIGLGLTGINQLCRIA